jgi:hypothetical protein
MSWLKLCTLRNETTRVSAVRRHDSQASTKAQYARSNASRSALIRHEPLCEISEKRRKR